MTLYTKSAGLLYDKFVIHSVWFVYRVHKKWIIPHTISTTNTNFHRGRLAKMFGCAKCAAHGPRSTKDYDIFDTRQ